MAFHVFLDQDPATAAHLPRECFEGSRCRRFVADIEIDQPQLCFMDAAFLQPFHDDGIADPRRCLQAFMDIGGDGFIHRGDIVSLQNLL